MAGEIRTAAEPPGERAGDPRFDLRGRGG